jgi:hypothetical protein
MEEEEEEISCTLGAAEEAQDVVREFALYTLTLHASPSSDMS